MCKYLHVWHRCCHIYMYLDTQFTQTFYENTSTITGHLRWNTYFNLLIEGQSMVFEQRGCISAQYLRSYLPTCLPRCASTVLAQEAGCRPNKRPIVTTPQEKPKFSCRCEAWKYIITNNWKIGIQSTICWCSCCFFLSAPENKGTATWKYPGTKVLGKGAQPLNTCRGDILWHFQRQSSYVRHRPMWLGVKSRFFPDQRMQIGGFQFPGEIRGLLGYFKWQWGNISPT